VRWRGATARSKALMVGVLLALSQMIVPATPSPGCTPPLLAFRLDDVQDWWISTAQKAVIQVFLKHDVPLTLAVIGGFIGEDTDLIKLIKTNSQKLEIANHGLHAKNASDGRSVVLTQEPAVTGEEIKRSNEKIIRTLGNRPNLYIPHQNQFNPSLLRILSELGFSHISSYCTWHLGKSECEDSCGYHDGTTNSCREPDRFGLIHVPAGASTQWKPRVGKVFRDPVNVLQEIRKSTDKYGFAVIMIHPQDFVHSDGKVASEALRALDDLLSILKAEGRYKAVNMSEVASSCR
jgi:peptidoglycan/xylan/chitin deacetylase (PgdA/CDA1 family)